MAWGPRARHKLATVKGPVLPGGQQGWRAVCKCGSAFQGPSRNISIAGVRAHVEAHAVHRGGER